MNTPPQCLSCPRCRRRLGYQVVGPGRGVYFCSCGYRLEVKGGLPVFVDSREGKARASAPPSPVVLRERHKIMHAFVLCAERNAGNSVADGALTAALLRPGRALHDQ